MSTPTELSEMERGMRSSVSPCPGELVLASAGTGKTYVLSTRMLELLAGGVSPDTILAATFTRKAAGEMLQRVLARLAEAVLDPEKAQELAWAAGGAAMAGGGSEKAGFPAGEVLQSVLENLHGLHVGTLDSFFVRLGRCFPSELGLPLDWRLGDPSALERLEEEAVQRVLGGASRQAVAEVVRAAFGETEARGVHRRLIKELRGLRSLLREAELTGSSAWSMGLPVPQGRWEGSENQRETFSGVLAGLAGAEIPLTRLGIPNKNFQKAVNTAMAALRRRDWRALCQGRLVQAVLSGERVFSGVSVPASLLDGLTKALEWARDQVGGELARRAQALVAIGRAYDAVLNDLQSREGIYGFEDITHRVAMLGAGGLPQDLWYRLGGRFQHLLLDEFQDTSRPQWHALRHLVEEILAEPMESRSAMLVADPKQSIYGWRGGEPGLLQRIAAHYQLGKRSLSRSFRSGAPILEFVNRVFGDLPSNPIWEGVPDLRSAVELWSEGFLPHQGKPGCPGYVRWETGPRPEKSRTARESYLAWAARRIREIREAAPHATLGVLVRRNRTAAYLVFQLRALGVEVSEEGGALLTDSPAVSTVLALLHLTDHPADSVARFQVALSPLGPLVGLERWDDEGLACQVALGIRRDLLHAGYGPTLYRWWRGLQERGSLDPREQERLLQLVELGYRWDGQRTLRSREFARYVEAETREAPSTASLRVMTVHRAKGLEFDVVAIPDLYEKLLISGTGPGGVLALRDRATGELLRILPRPPNPLLSLLPEAFSEAARQERERDLLDALGVLYVALTRPRYALHLMSPGEEEETKRAITAPTYADLLRGSLKVSMSRESGSVVFLSGDPQWPRMIPGWDAASGEGGGGMAAEPPPRPRLKPHPFRRRHLPIRAPTDLSPGSPTFLAGLLALEARREHAKAVGEIVHAWLASLEWLEEWNPSEEDLFSLAQEVVPTFPHSELRPLLHRFREWLEQREIRRLLQREKQLEAEILEVARETPFLVRLGESMVRGRMDRLVLGRGREGVRWACLVDFKTDMPGTMAADGLEKELRRYAPQMRTYREAVAVLYGLPAGKVRALLALLPWGRVVEVPAKC